MVFVPLTAVQVDSLYILVRLRSLCCRRPRSNPGVRQLARQFEPPRSCTESGGVTICTLQLWDSRTLMRFQAKGTSSGGFIIALCFNELVSRRYCISNIQLLYPLIWFCQWLVVRTTCPIYLLPKDYHGLVGHLLVSSLNCLRCFLKRTWRSGTRDVRHGGMSVALVGDVDST